MSKKIKVVCVVLILIVLFCNGCAFITENPNSEETPTVNDENERTDDDMQTATPESVGISSQNITSFLNGLKKNNLATHSILVMKDGKLIAEGYADGFDQNFLHRMYSVSKSVVSLSVGYLISEGKLSYTDTVGKFFPEYVKSTTDKRILATTVQDLLLMDTPYFERDVYRGWTGEDFVKAFFDGTPDKTPGQGVMSYDTAGSHVLGAIVEKVTGKDFLEYLQEKVLDKMGFSKNAYCINAPEGYAWGGSGVCCTARDILKLAQLLLQEGEWNGEQIYPADYAKAATAFQIQDCNSKGQVGTQTYFDYQGYGYLIWQIKFSKTSGSNLFDGKTGWAFLGMGGQDVIVVPELNLIVALTQDNQGNSTARKTVFELVEKYLVNTATNEPLAEDEQAQSKLKTALEKMKLPVQGGTTTSKIVSKIQNKTFAAKTSSYMEKFTLTFSEDGTSGILTYQTPNGEKKLNFGLGENLFTTLQEPGYSGTTIGKANGVGYRSAVSAGWTAFDTLVIKVQVVDSYFGNMTMTFRFTDENELHLKVTGAAEWFLMEYIGHKSGIPKIDCDYQYKT